MYKSGPAFPNCAGSTGSTPSFPCFWPWVFISPGALLKTVAPSLGTNGPQLLIWGFFISTVVLLHATCTINSLDHMFGTRRFETDDTSRNNALLALLTLGEGWHNNHHRYAVSARQGFRWWEVDITYYLLVILSWLGIIRELRPVPVGLTRNDRERAS